MKDSAGSSTLVDAKSGSAESPSETRPTNPSAGAVRGATSMLTDLAAITSGRLGYAVLSFVVVFVATRMLGPAAYGTVATATIVANLIYTVSGAWTGAAVRRYGREELEQEGHMSRLTWNRTVIAAPLLAVAILLTVALKAFGVLPPDLTWALVWLSVLSALGTLLADHWSCLLETGGRMKVSASVQVGRQALYAGALGALFVVGLRASAAFVVALSAITPVVLALVVLPVVWRLGLRPIVTDRGLMRRMLWLSFPIIGLTISQYLIGSVDLVVLRAFRTRADAGVYSIAYQAYNVAQSAAVAAPAVLVPLFVSLRMADRMDLIARYLRRGVPQLTLLVATLMGLAISVLPVVVPILFGHAFAGAALPLSVLCVALSFLCGAYLMTPILLLYEQTRATAMITTIAAFINIAGDLLTVGVLNTGIVGPAIATAVALGFVFAADYALARRLLAANAWFDLSVLAPLAAGLVPTLLLSDVAAVVVGLAATSLTAAIVIALRRPFNAEDAELVAKLEMPAGVRRLAIKAIEILS